ncbi:MAG: hypothetical protein IPM63_08035 [Acidobacteriota bacterium]|nr:MAG: hypothetical protein IPM63_08035 [Acidobacteriota bacterium]
MWNLFTSLWHEALAILVFAFLTFLIPYELMRRRIWTSWYAGFVIAPVSSFLLPFGVYLSAWIHVFKYQTPEMVDNGPFMAVAAATFLFPAIWGIALIIALIACDVGADAEEEKSKNAP